MEPISLTAIAIAVTTIFFTKVVEKSGEEFGDFLLNKAKTLKAELSEPL